MQTQITASAADALDADHQFAASQAIYAKEVASVFSVLKTYEKHGFFVLKEQDWDFIQNEFLYAQDRVSNGQKRLKSFRELLAEYERVEGNSEDPCFSNNLLYYHREENTQIRGIETTILDTHQRFQFGLDYEQVMAGSVEGLSLSDDLPASWLVVSKSLRALEKRVTHYKDTCYRTYLLGKVSGILSFLSFESDLEGSEKKIDDFTRECYRQYLNRVRLAIINAASSDEDEVLPVPIIVGPDEFKDEVYEGKTYGEMISQFREKCLEEKKLASLVERDLVEETGKLTEMLSTLAGLANNKKNRKKFEEGFSKLTEVSLKRYQHVSRLYHDSVDEKRKVSEGRLTDIREKYELLFTDRSAEYCCQIEAILKAMEEDLESDRKIRAASPNVIQFFSFQKKIMAALPGFEKRLRDSARLPRGDINVSSSHDRVTLLPQVVHNLASDGLGTASALLILYVYDVVKDLGVDVKEIFSEHTRECMAFFNFFDARIDAELASVERYVKGRIDESSVRAKFQPLFDNIRRDTGTAENEPVEADDVLDYYFARLIDFNRDDLFDMLNLYKDQAEKNQLEGHLEKCVIGALTQAHSYPRDEVPLSFLAYVLPESGIMDERGCYTSEFVEKYLKLKSLYEKAVIENISLLEYPDMDAAILTNFSFASDLREKSEHEEIASTLISLTQEVQRELTKVILEYNPNRILDLSKLAKTLIERAKKLERSVEASLKGQELESLDFHRRDKFQQMKMEALSLNHYAGLYNKKHTDFKEFAKKAADQRAILDEYLSYPTENKDKLTLKGWIDNLNIAHRLLAKNGISLPMYKDLSTIVEHSAPLRRDEVAFIPRSFSISHLSRGELTQVVQNPDWLVATLAEELIKCANKQRASRETLFFRRTPSQGQHELSDLQGEAAQPLPMLDELLNSYATILTDNLSAICGRNKSTDSATESEDLTGVVEEQVVNALVDFFSSVASHRASSGRLRELSSLVKHLIFARREGILKRATFAYGVIHASKERKLCGLLVVTRILYPLLCLSLYPVSILRHDLVRCFTEDCEEVIDFLRVDQATLFHEELVSSLQSNFPDHLRNIGENNSKISWARRLFSILCVPFLVGIFLGQVEASIITLSFYMGNLEEIGEGSIKVVGNMATLIALTSILWSILIAAEISKQHNVRSPFLKCLGKLFPRLSGVSSQVIFNIFMRLETYSAFPLNIGVALLWQPENNSLVCGSTQQPVMNRSTTAGLASSLPPTQDKLWEVFEDVLPAAYPFAFIGLTVSIFALVLAYKYPYLNNTPATSQRMGDIKQLDSQARLSPKGLALVKIWHYFGVYVDHTITSFVSICHFAWIACSIKDSTWVVMHPKTEHNWAAAIVTVPFAAMAVFIGIILRFIAFSSAGTRLCGERSKLCRERSKVRNAAQIMSLFYNNLLGLVTNTSFTLFYFRYFCLANIPSLAERAPNEANLAVEVAAISVSIFVFLLFLTDKLLDLGLSVILTGDQWESESLYKEAHRISDEALKRNSLPKAITFFHQQTQEQSNETPLLEHGSKCESSSLSKDADNPFCF